MPLNTWQRLLPKLVAVRHVLSHFVNIRNGTGMSVWLFTKYGTDSDLTTGTAWHMLHSLVTGHKQNDTSHNQYPQP